MKTKLLKKLRKEHQITYIPSLKQYEICYPHDFDIEFHTAYSYKNAKEIQREFILDYGHQFYDKYCKKHKIK